MNIEDVNIVRYIDIIKLFYINNNKLLTIIYAF